MFLGIDIGGTHTKIGLVAPQTAQVVAQQTLDTKSFDHPTMLVQACKEWFDTQIADITPLLGIGIGAPNGNFYKGTIEFAPNLRWKGIIPLRDLFAQQFGCPAYLTNDANAAAIGEGLYGAAQGLRDYLVITLGTGLGSGFVANGNLIYGHDGFAGELGHIIIERHGGRVCACGRQGCLETYASASGIVRTATLLLEEVAFVDSQLHGFSHLSAKDITHCALQGDPLALHIFDLTAHQLGFALAQAIAITSPQAIIFFGGLALAGDLLLEPVRRYTESYLLPIFQNKVLYLPSGVDAQHAAILGAAALAATAYKGK